MFKKIWNFVKYNNGFIILLAVVFAVGGSVFAMSNDAVQNTVQKSVSGIIGEKKIIEIGIDNSILLNTDIDKLADQSKIIAVTDDENNFYVDYEIKTLDILDNKWQEIAKPGRLIVSKSVLGEDDLGVYAIKQINEVAFANLAEIKIAQAREKEKGETKTIKNEEYSGLLGVIMDIKDNFVEETPSVELVPSSNDSISFDGSVETEDSTINSDSSLVIPGHDGEPVINSGADIASSSDSNASSSGVVVPEESNNEDSLENPADSEVVNDSDKKDKAPFVDDKASSETSPSTTSSEASVNN